MPIPVRIALAAATLALIARSARACPNDEANDASKDHGSAATAASTSAPACVAWRPHAWTPPGVTLLARGLWVSRDPVDGALGMPPSRLFPPAVGPGTFIPDNTPVRIDQLADGTLIAHLDDRWADFAVVRLGPDGKPAWTCVSGQQGLERFMAHPVIVVTPPPVKREEK